MGVRGDRWRDTVEPHFGFLVDLGFADVDVDDGKSFWGQSVRFRSRTAAVQITKSTEFQSVEVDLIRLVDGAVPPYPIWITADRIDWVSLASVVAARRPDLVPDVRAAHGLSNAEVQSQLALWARLLRDVAPDFLAGEFAAVEDAARLLRREVEEHPQQVVVYLPSDRPDEVVASTVAEVNETLPPNVSVEVRRYRRPFKRPRRGDVP